MMRAVLLAMCLVACAADLEDIDAVFTRPSNERVLCGLGVDADDLGIDALERGMQRAAERGEVLDLFAHHPGKTITRERVDAILSAADRQGLPYRTFPELASHAGPGLAFGFDDFSVEAWWELRDLLEAHGARVTFFVSNYAELDATRRSYLHELAEDGHAIEAHGMGHRDAALYTDAHGLDAYLAVEIDPLLDAMRADGLEPTTFAYPYGSRTRQLDAALLERFTLLRSVTFVDESLINSSPCPY